MKAIIDTSSLTQLVRYCLPFDTDGKLLDFIKEEYEEDRLIIIDQVVKELSGIPKVSASLKPLLSNKKKIYKTNLILPNKDFFYRLDTDFCNIKTLNHLKRTQGFTDEEYSSTKRKWIEGADCKLMLLAKHFMSLDALAEHSIFVVTEETIHDNDSKTIKKIPTICGLLGVEFCTVVDLLTNHYSFKGGGFVK